MTHTLTAQPGTQLKQHQYHYKYQYDDNNGKGWTSLITVTALEICYASCKAETEARKQKPAGFNFRNFSLR